MRQEGPVYRVGGSTHKGQRGVAHEPWQVKDLPWLIGASLVETCKLNDVDPQTYFADVLDKLVNLWPVARIDELMPWAWTKSRTVDQLAA